MGLLICRGLYYKWTNAHLFLFDLCHAINACVLIHIWFYPGSEYFAQAVHGFTGMLAICIPLFRNSFVPHALDRVTSFQVHLMPLLMLLVLRRFGTEDQRRIFQAEEFMTPWPSFCIYLTW